MCDANDRGYECLLLSDCTGATDAGNHEAALKMVTMQGGASVHGVIAETATTGRAGERRPPVLAPAAVAAHPRAMENGSPWVIGGEIMRPARAEG
jgi:hypothetical protein